MRVKYWFNMDMVADANSLNNLSLEIIDLKQTIESYIYNIEFIITRALVVILTSNSYFDL